MSAAVLRCLSEQIALSAGEVVATNLDNQTSHGSAPPNVGNKPADVSASPDETRP